MEYLILGLLILSPMTGYELQQFIKQNLSFICSHSAGSTQTALAKLQRKGNIQATSQETGKRHKKVFTITDSGRASFATWIAQPMQATKAKNMELSRLFFLGLAKPQERIQAIRAYILQIQETQALLKTIQARFAAIRQNNPSPDQDWPSIFHFQGYTIEYGIAAAQFEQDWYTHLLHELEESL